LEWLPLLQIAQGLEKGLEVPLAEEHRLAVVAATDEVVD
jgi:hypothetical protein